MSPSTQIQTERDLAVQAAERERAKDIRALAGRHNLGPLGEEHIDKGTSIELFKGIVLEEINRRGSTKPLEVVAGDLELSSHDRERYSLTRLLHAQLAAREGAGSKEREAAAFELECSQAIAKRLGKEPRGAFLPYDALCQRGPEGDLSFFKRTLTATGGGSSGGALMQPTVLGSQYVPPNYNVPIIVDAGARVLPGLIGNILIPAMTSGKSGTWLSAENAAISEGDATFAQIALNPCDVGTVCDISRRLIIQSNPDVDGLVRDDIAIAIAESVDAGALNGSGASGQPTGVLSESGLTVISSGTNGGPLTWGNVTYLPQSVGAANRLIKGAPLGFITNWQAFAHAMRTTKTSGYPVFIAEYAENKPLKQGPRAGTIGGLPVHISQNVPSNLTKGTGSSLSAMLFGNWDDLLLGEWGVLDMLVDPYTFSNTGAVRVRAIVTVGVAVRYGASFSAIKDIVTT